MPRETALSAPRSGAEGWPLAGAGLALVLLALFLATLPEWAAMAHQWWNIDTYSHILLIPPILATLVWFKKDELAKNEPHPWWPGLAWLLAGLSLCAGGRASEINLLAQAGAVIAMQGAVLAALGPRAGLLLAFPLAYALFLVPFGDEFIPALQVITAHIAIALTQASGVHATTIDGINIDTPAGLFIIAEACSGVKFLIAMLALGVLVAWTCFASWKRRGLFLLACVIVPVIANGVRAWATIFIAQYVGAEAAGSFDHIVYGWVFFGIVIALVLGFAWRWFEREPEAAGLHAEDLENLGVARLERYSGPPGAVLTALLIAAGAFALLPTPV